MSMLDGALKGLIRGAVRRRLTTKDGNKNYYKGTGSGRMGHWTLKGQYIIEPWRLRQFMIPNLLECELKPFVSPKADDDIRKRHNLIDYFNQTPALEDELATVDQTVPEDKQSLLMRACSEVAHAAYSTIRAPKHKTKFIKPPKKLHPRDRN
ncbi:hypothetical protein BATDEDRAFT_26107 [Batrachochytrium dendrobatidis JAM81]|uniref:Uncharacterized protein n=2 Tax=Batrachochytrium dendrobatidis TaxID=109871 RepID=F4P730_BATDJ|nr:uncharacterized protein BATDEDRAFT_26107 [Batrachochytrium dendrobatidis JAM81]EGF78979.1 hypothetical protein BATDEDRAFT_26107 [Batrachochytrium dendrobatidis JAM81]KAJ8325447.1 hypothetical protein O5D80_006384 [Batrachochytrium dendrobatidis]KAK5670264.1 hypothetical protein QVD99_003279 [Batrachochytrium dendrobatidis]OAJ42469.1 hypothetical protein BDEG_25918 [Batrachochytrium dendrobatidis JEL423]|eukprot:XP_006680309.1 hypothetical protein BATDEDRAFT_26107 [Batrachochytrium dendrobatidis JAM81]